MQLAPVAHIVGGTGDRDHATGALRQQGRRTGGVLGAGARIDALAGRPDLPGQT